MSFLIRRCEQSDFQQIWDIINDGAQSYKGFIPADCLEEPYMSKGKLQHEIEQGVEFWAYEESGTLLAVMGRQNVEDVALIRHAYVRSRSQKQGLGGYLLSHLRTVASSPMLVGTWTDATWAIKFYEKHGFEPVSQEEKIRLLRKYWTVPDRQIETSSVLADQQWRRLRAAPAYG